MNLKSLSSKLKIFLSSLFIFIFTFSFVAYAATNYPTPSNLKYINDYVGVIKQTEAENIISIGKELESKTSAEATVVIIDSTQGVPIEEYAVNLFRTWGIGQKGKDNGLLILLAINDKAWRVEVGRGLEGAVPDALSNRIMESLGKPSFIKGNFGEGLVNSYSSFCDYIAKEYNVTLDKSLNVKLQENNYDSSENTGVGIILGIVILLFFLDLIFNRGRVFSSLFQAIFISNAINRRNGPRGGGFGGGSGGGFGGGGSSGGG